MEKKKTTKNKVKKKKERTKQVTNIGNLDQKSSICKIGEIYLEDPEVSVDHLASLALGLLKDKEVKDYLELVNKKKTMGNYHG